MNEEATDARIERGVGSGLVVAEDDTNRRMEGKKLAYRMWGLK